jgi:hypothetical protein
MTLELWALCRAKRCLPSEMLGLPRRTARERMQALAFDATGLRARKAAQRFRLELMLKQAESAEAATNLLLLELLETL